MGPLKTGLSSSCGAKSMSKGSLVSDHQLTLSKHPAGGGGSACAGLEGEKGGNEKDQHRPYLRVPNCTGRGWKGGLARCTDPVHRDSECGTLYTRMRVCVCVLNCVRFCNYIDYSPPGSSVHGILQARVLEWVAISFSRGSS